MVDIEKVGRFEMPPLKRRQDFVTWLYILKNGNHAYGLNESLAMYRRATNSLSSNKLKTIRYNWYVYRKIEKLSLFKTLDCFCGYAYNACKKRIYVNHYKNKLNSFGREV